MNIINIENAYTRFKTLHDTLVFRSQSFKEKEKNSKGEEKEIERFEIRSNSRFIFQSKDKEEIETMVTKLNLALEPIITEEFLKFKEEVNKD